MNDEVEIRIFPDGSSYKVKETKLRQNQLGIWEKVTIEPAIEVGVCANPHHKHGLRPVIEGFNAFRTDKGNLLCLECFRRNQRRKLFNLFLGWLIEFEIY